MKLQFKLIKQNDDNNRHNRIYRGNHFVNCLFPKFDKQNRKKQFGLFANEFFWSWISLFSLGFNEVFALYNLGRMLDYCICFWTIEIHKPKIIQIKLFASSNQSFYFLNWLLKKKRYEETDQRRH